MNINELRDLQVKFEKERKNLSSEYKSIYRLINKFRRDYSITKILALELDEYINGKGDNTTFCNRLESELNDWGNIHGSTAIKFGIYYGVLGKDKNPQYRVSKNKFGTDINKAFEKIKYSIVELLQNPDDINILKANLLAPIVKGKILSVYFPDKFLNIYSDGHLSYFIDVLGLYNNSKSTLDKQNHLLKFKNDDAVMKDWSNFEFNKFLYLRLGTPNRAIDKDKLSKNLSSYFVEDFPSIENVISTFVDLKTNSLNKTTKSANLKNKPNVKVDYQAQSKRFKKIGDRGEQIVFKAEYEKLVEIGRKDLADRMVHTSKQDDSAGYDIESFNFGDDKTKYIEVKSTMSSIGISDIYISINELEKANSLDNYYIYLVYDTGTLNPKIWVVKGTNLLNDNNIELIPIQYKISIKTEAF